MTKFWTNGQRGALLGKMPPEWNFDGLVGNMTDCRGVILPLKTPQFGTAFGIPLPKLN